MGVMARLSEWLVALSSGRVALLALVVFVLFGAVALPAQAARAAAYSGEVGAPDTSFFYTARELYDWAEAYGPEGRAAYVRARFTFDALFPLVYTFFLVTALSWLLPRAFGPGSGWVRGNLLPLAAMVFDFLENGAAALVMARYPTLSPGLDALAGPLTTVKWLLVGASFVLLVVALVAAAWRRLRA